MVAPSRIYNLSINEKFVHIEIRTQILAEPNISSRLGRVVPNEERAPLISQSSIRHGHTSSSESYPRHPRTSSCRKRINLRSSFTILVLSTIAKKNFHSTPST